MSSGVEDNQSAKADGVVAPRRPCRVCAELIEAAARKCVHCDSYQNWRRHFGFSSTVLSLLIALFAVLGQSVPAIRNAFHERRSEIGFALQSASVNRIATLVFNDGDRSGTVSQGQLTLPDGRRLRLTLPSNGGVALVPPNNSMLVNYSVQGNLGRPPNLLSTCKFAVLISDENGIRSYDDQNLLCGNLSGLYHGWRFDEDGEPIRVAPGE